MSFPHRLTNHGAAKVTAASEHAQRFMNSLEGLHAQENAALEAMPTVSYGSDGEEGEEKLKTWLEVAEEEVWA